MGTSVVVISNIYCSSQTEQSLTRGPLIELCRLLLLRAVLHCMFDGSAVTITDCKICCKLEYQYLLLEQLVQIVDDPKGQV